VPRHASPNPHLDWGLDFSVFRPGGAKQPSSSDCRRIVSPGIHRGKFSAGALFEVRRNNRGDYQPNGSFRLAAMRGLRGVWVILERRKVRRENRRAEHFPFMLTAPLLKELTAPPLKSARSFLLHLRPRREVCTSPYDGRDHR